MLGPFSARDKIIPHSVSAVARVECSMSMELGRNLPFCLLYMKKKASESRKKFTVMRRRACFENFRKYEAVYATMLYRSENN